MGAKKKIYINGRFLTQAVTGTQRFAIETLNALDELLTNNDPAVSDLEYVCLIPDSQKRAINPNWKRIKVQAVGRFNGNLWEQIDLPVACRGYLLLSLTNTGPAFYANQVVVIHDMSVYRVPDAYSFMFKLKYKFIYKMLARRCRKIITVSEFSRNEISSLLDLDTGKIQVIYEGREHALRPVPDNNVLEKFALKSDPYLLCVGSRSKHKNINVVIESLSRLSSPIKLVLAGGKYSNVFATNDIVSSRQVIETGYVNDSQLSSLYRNAICFIFPSIYEGFGLPPLEAMALGCPVISSSASPMPEILGGAAMYFDPADAVSLAAAIDIVSTQTHHRNELIAAGSLKAANYSWRQTAKTLASTLQQSIR